MSRNNHQQYSTSSLPIPEELGLDLEEYPMAFTDISNMFDKVLKLTNDYPSLKRFIIEKISEDLDEMYRLDQDGLSIKIIDTSTPNVDIIDLSDVKIVFQNKSIDCVTFLLNCLSPIFHKKISELLDKIEIRAYVKGEDGQPRYQTWFSRLLQKMDFLSIRETYKAKLEDFWQKNFDNYRTLAKFSFLNALLQQQKMEAKALSSRALDLIGQSIKLDMTSFNRIQVDMLIPSIPAEGIKVSTLTLDGQVSSDILFFQDAQNSCLLLYIPQHKPPFIAFESKEKMIDWIMLQSKDHQTLKQLKSHFPLTSQLRLEPPFTRIDLQEISKNKARIEQDIFTPIAFNQKARSIEDLYSHDIDNPTLSNYLSTQPSVFTTINLAIGSILECFPDVAPMSDFLRHTFPNPYETASRIIQKEIQQKLDLDIDPNKTFIRFSLYKKDCSPNFSGDATILYEETLSLVGAVLSKHVSRYLSRKAEITLYTDPTGKGLYVVGSELDITLEEIQRFLEEMDLDSNYRTQYLEKLKIFWEKHPKDVKEFIKYQYLSQAIGEYSSSSLSKEAFELISDVGINSLIIEENPSSKILNQNISVKGLHIRGYIATDIFLFQDKRRPLLVLYIASDISPFSVFSNAKELQAFLTDKSKMEDWTGLIALHFPVHIRNSISQCLLEACDNPPVKFENTETSLFESLYKNIKDQSYIDIEKLNTYRRTRDAYEDSWSNTMTNISNLAGWATILLLVPSLIFPVFNFSLLFAFVIKTGVDVYRMLSNQSLEVRYQIAIDLGLDLVGILLSTFISHQIWKAASFSKQLPYPPANARKAAFSLPISRARGKDWKVVYIKSPAPKKVFFNSRVEMKAWELRGKYNVDAWFLGEQFLLFSGSENKANHLIISAHGGYTLVSKSIPVPKNTTLIALGPHGWNLIDPGINKVVRGKVLPYASISKGYPQALPGSASSRSYYREALPKFLQDLLGREPLNYDRIDPKVLSGTHIPGHIRNYNLAKFQHFAGESYEIIADTVTASRLKTSQDFVDILTVRNRYGSLNPDLEDLFEQMRIHNIHYDRITLMFCRSNQLRERISSRLVPFFVPVG